MTLNDAALEPVSGAAARQTTFTVVSERYDSALLLEATETHTTAG